MANGHGGQRTPEHPAAVSGPGALSQRTDGGPASQPRVDLPNAAYGEAKNFSEIQGGAPVAGQQPAPQPIPLGADSQRPDEAVTAGSPMGEGVGPTQAGIDNRTEAEQDAAEWKSALPLLEFMANSQGASPSTRALIRRIKGSL